MKNILVFVSVILFVFASSVTVLGQKIDLMEKPSSGNWYKGSLHTHSLWSDGDAFPEMVMDWHKSNGYNFIAMSDHNTLEQKEKWKTISATPVLQQSYESYLVRFGKEWIETKEDTGGIHVRLKTFEEYKPLFEEPGRFLIIPSEEISDRYDGSPVHLNGINLRELIRPKKGESVVEVLQNNINAVLEQEKQTGVPMLVQVNHPNYKYALSVPDITVLENARFFEVFNGYGANNNYGDSIHLSTEAIWDRVNISFLEQNKPLIYGVASDDSHHYQVFDSKSANPGRAWVMVKAGELTPESLIDAMKRGDFYASTGVSLKEISFKNKQLKIVVESEPGVNYRIQFIGYRAQEKEASILKETAGREAVFELNNDILFVRAKIISDKRKENPTCEGDVEVAWSQPFRGQHYSFEALEKGKLK